MLFILPCPFLPSLLYRFLCIAEHFRPLSCLRSSYARVAAGNWN